MKVGKAEGLGLGVVVYKIEFIIENAGFTVVSCAMVHPSASSSNADHCAPVHETFRV